MLLHACLLGIGEVRYARLLFASISFPLRDAPRSRAELRLWTLCFRLFSFKQVLCRTKSGKQLRCHHMFLFMFGCPCLICHVYMLSHACRIFYMSRYKRWVGGLIAHFCHAVFISHPTRSMNSFPPVGSGIFEMKTQCSEIFMCANKCNSRDVAMQQQPHHAEPEIFPLSAQDGKVCARISFQLHIQFEHVSRKICQ